MGIREDTTTFFEKLSQKYSLIIVHSGRDYSFSSDLKTSKSLREVLDQYAQKYNCRYLFSSRSVVLIPRAEFDFEYTQLLSGEIYGAVKSIRKILSAILSDSFPLSEGFGAIYRSLSEPQRSVLRMGKSLSVSSLSEKQQRLVASAIHGHYLQTLQEQTAKLDVVFSHRERSSIKAFSQGNSLLVDWIAVDRNRKIVGDIPVFSAQRSEVVRLHESVVQRPAPVREATGEQRRAQSVSLHKHGTLQEIVDELCRLSGQAIGVDPAIAQRELTVHAEERTVREILELVARAFRWRVVANRLGKLTLSLPSLAVGKSLAAVIQELPKAFPADVLEFFLSPGLLNASPPHALLETERKRLISELAPLIVPDKEVEFDRLDKNIQKRILLFALLEFMRAIQSLLTDSAAVELGEIERVHLRASGSQMTMFTLGNDGVPKVSVSTSIRTVDGVIDISR